MNIKKIIKLIDVTFELIFGIVVLIVFVWYIFTDTYIWTEKVPFLIIMSFILLSSNAIKRSK